MASGHCEPRKQAEHMAAPTNLQRDESSCQPGAVHTWPLCGVQRCLLFGRYQGV